MSKQTFEVIAGSHFEGDREFKKGERLQSSKDLCAIFPQKFKVVESVTIAAATDVDEDGDEDSPLGENVTKDFPVAEANDFLVFVREDEYHISTKEDPDTALNKKGLAREKVTKFVEKKVAAK